MDDDRLTLSGDYDAKGRGRGNRRWESIDSRLDRAVHDVRYEPYDRAPPRERRSRPLLTLFMLALAAAAVCFAVAPVMAFRSIRSAAEFGDVQALGQLIDYNAVRQSLRTQIRPTSVERAPPADLLHDPFGALRRAWEPVSPQVDVDPYLTPEAIALLAEGRPIAAGVKPAPKGGVLGGPLPEVMFWSTDRVRLGVEDPGRPARQTIFTFERRKPFTWRLVGVRLPEGPVTTVAK